MRSDALIHFLIPTLPAASNPRAYQINIGEKTSRSRRLDSYYQPAR